MTDGAGVVARKYSGPMGAAVSAGSGRGLVSTRPGNPASSLPMTGRGSTRVAPRHADLYAEGLMGRVRKADQADAYSNGDDRGSSCVTQAAAVVKAMYQCGFMSQGPTVLPNMTEHDLTRVTCSWEVARQMLDEHPQQSRAQHPSRSGRLQAQVRWTLRCRRPRCQQDSVAF